MHVTHASRLTRLIVVTGLFFLAILLSLTMIDYSSREWVNPPALLLQLRAGDHCVRAPVYEPVISDQ